MRVLRYGLLAASAIVAVLAVLAAAAHLEFVRTRVLDWAVARASRDFGIGIEADSLRYNLIAASAELRNVRLSAPGARPFFRADAIRIGLNRRALPGAVEIDRLELERPHLTIVRHADGTTNLPASRSTSTSAPSPIHLGRVALSAMSVEFEDESAGHRLTAAPIDLVLDTSEGASVPGAFGPTPISATLGPNPRSISGTIAGRLGFDGSRLTVHELRVDVPEARLALDGWIDVLAETNRVEARARLDTDLARASRLVMQRDISLTGSATADVEVRGEIADPTVNIKLLGPMVRLGAAPSINIAADATYAAGRLDVDSLSVTSDAGAIDVNGTLAVTAAGAARESRLVGRIENLDVDRLLEASGVRGPVALGTTAAGQIDVTLDAAVPLDADAWRHAERERICGAHADRIGPVDWRPPGPGNARWPMDSRTRAPIAGRPHVDRRHAVGQRATTRRPDDTLVVGKHACSD